MLFLYLILFPSGTHIRPEIVSPNLPSMILKSSFPFPISSSFYASFRIVYSALFSNSVFSLWPDFPFCLCDEGSSSRKELYMVLPGNRFNYHSGITFNYIFDSTFLTAQVVYIGIANHVKTGMWLSPSTQWQSSRQCLFSFPPRERCEDQVCF